METNNNFNPQDNNEREIDLSELFSVIWDGKWLVVMVTYYEAADFHGDRVGSTIDCHGNISGHILCKKNN